ncbi:hypothetical protein H5410_001936, partial [Solanum commersonii]
MESLSGFCNFILKFEFAVNSHFCLFLEASKDFLFRLCQSLSGSTRGKTRRYFFSKHGLMEVLTLEEALDEASQNIDEALDSMCVVMELVQKLIPGCYEIVDVRNATSSWYE